MNASPPTERPQEFASFPRDGWIFTDGPVLLMYHKIAAPPRTTRLPGLYVHPHQFERHLDELLSAGLQCVPFGGLAAHSTGATTGSFCLTFDDGFCNAFDHALPALQKRGLRATQFIVGSLIGRDDAWDRSAGEPPQPLMDDAQIRDWLAAGHEIGAHTLTHPLLTKIPREQARQEIFDCKKLLEDRFGRRIDHFCYPYGDHNAAVVDLVGEAGYTLACTAKFGAVRLGTRPLELPRVMAMDLPPFWRRAARKFRRILTPS